jgi:formate--tetrahydrofolate ligase
MPSDIEIAQQAVLRPIRDVAGEIGLSDDDLRPYGHYVAKIDPRALEGRERNGKVVLVTGMTPTPAGEGKSTVAVGLAQALRRLEKKTMLCLREPSLGPVFGIKGGAAGGGYSQVLPMDEINLHFTGDFHAITSAHSLLSAVMDNNLFRGNSLELDIRRINWKRAIDMNDRALRSAVIGLGGVNGGIPREEGWSITAASEIMAIFCLASNLADFEERVANIVLGARRDGTLVRAGDLNVAGAQGLLMKEALWPNLVQTIEGGPALVHGGPFANIAHGCNSVIATHAGNRGHRSRIRFGPRGRKVLRHQVPNGRNPAGSDGARGHDPGDEAPRRKGGRWRTRRTRGGVGQSRCAHRQPGAVRGAGRRSGESILQ